MKIIDNIEKGAGYINTIGQLRRYQRAFELTRIVIVNSFYNFQRLAKTITQPLSSTCFVFFYLNVEHMSCFHLDVFTEAAILKIHP